MNAPAKILTPEQEWEAMLPRLREMRRDVDRMLTRPVSTTTHNQLSGVRFNLMMLLGEI
jgi:hypothetical protein